MKENKVVKQVLWLLWIAIAMSVLNVVLMVIALEWRSGGDYGEILLMTGGTINIFMQAFVLWPLSGYILRKEAKNRVYSGLVRWRHWLFGMASVVTLVTAAIGIVSRAR